MKVILKSSLISLLLVTSQLSFAGSFVDSATVVSVEKVYKQYRVDEPYEDCYIQETTQNSGDGSATNELFGAAIGGAVGNKLGKGDGKDAMTILGALMGASIANDAEKNANKTGKKVIRQEVCETKVRQVIEKRLSHYLVTVDYADREVSFQSKRRPSKDVIKIEVTVDGLGN